MEYLNPRGKPFTSADAAALLRGLAKVPIDPNNFQGEEREIALGILAIQTRVDEAISLYESKQGEGLTPQKRELLKQSLTAKLLQGSPASDINSISIFFKRSQKSFAELLKLSEKRHPRKKDSHE